MTDREKAIATAYTGINMLEGERFNEFYKYLEELYGRPVYTHEIPFLGVQEKAKDDFIKLCKELTQTEIIRCKDCKHKVMTENGEYCPEDIVCDFWESDGLTAGDFCSYAEMREST